MEAVTLASTPLEAGMCVTALPTNLLLFVLFKEVFLETTPLKAASIPIPISLQLELDSTATQYPFLSIFVQNCPKVYNMYGL